MGDSDVEIEDEWEEVQSNAPAALADIGDITINFGEPVHLQAAGGNKRKLATTHTYSKKEREDALQVHRVHALCQLAHALLHDQAAADSELQALLLSLLPAKLLDAAAAAATSEDPSAANWLPDLLRWFHRTFALSPAPYMAANKSQQQAASPAAAAAAGSGKPSPAAAAKDWQHEMLADLGLHSGSGVPVVQQLLSCVCSRTGSSVQLAALLVALLRAVGFLTRSVWSLDPLPFKPAAVEALARGSSLRSKTPAAAAAAGAGSSKGKSRASINSRKRSAPAAAADQNGAAAGTAAAAVAAAGVKSKRSRNFASAGANKQQSIETGSETEQTQQVGGVQHTHPQQQQQQHDQLQQQRSKRRGDEEFELQIAMAMASTAAEAESRAAAAAAVAAGSTQADSTGRPPGGRTNSNIPAAAAAASGSKSKYFGSPGKISSPAATATKQPLASLINKGVSAASLKAAAAASKTADGFLWQPNPSLAPRVWCEVYIGSSADGSWYHVDGLLGCFNQPGVVEASTARSLPLSYVVACQAGAPKDVTRRYAANFISTLRWRDETWWIQTMHHFRSTSAHLPRHLAQQMTTSNTQQLVNNTAVAAAAAAGQTSTSGSAANRSADLTSKQQQNAGSSRAGAVNLPAAGAAAGSCEAALRAAREDAELSCRADRQAAAPPTTIEGFKAHPLYVLERHITKYQALSPNAAKLGTHRGEPYYSRKDLHDLHTRERWRREGRDVQDSELDKPAKTIKKRAVPVAAAATGADRSSSGRFSGGWGPWQRSNSSSFSRKGSLADAQSLDAAAVPAGDNQTAANGTPAAGGVEESDSVLLYGYWQTVEWAPPAAVGGKVPKNERGNVEVPPFAKALPAGTRHINLPGLAPLCRKLGIDFAPALVGFDVQGGRMVPRIEGVVVCEEFEQDVVQLHLQREQDKAAAAEQRLQQEAAQAWRQLLHSMWTRLQLQRKYGAAAVGAAGGSDSVLADQAPGVGGLLQQKPSAAANKARGIIQGLHDAEQQKTVQTAGSSARLTKGSRRKKLPGSVGHAGQDGLILRGDEQPTVVQPSVTQQQQNGEDELGENLLDGVEVEEF